MSSAVPPSLFTEYSYSVFISAFAFVAARKISMLDDRNIVMIRSLISPSMQELCAPSLSFDALWNDHCYRIFASLCHTESRKFDVRCTCSMLCVIIVACSLDNNSDN